MALTTPPAYPADWLQRFDLSDEPADSNDPRSAFAHDRDRIIYSSAFRRLAGKSQVVSAYERGNFHTRLTHTLKVAQLGRRVAEHLRLMIAGEQMGGQDRILAPDPDLIEAACLAHDLGHPPFGHLGEQTLNERVDSQLERLNQEWKPGRITDCGGFQGNAQTFRILSYLGVRDGGRPRTGLNLTKATLAATVKYQWTRAQSPRGEGDRDKWGAYGPNDREHLAEVVAPQKPKYLVDPTFEAQVMDWCDDVTYAVHDLIDFFQSGHIPLDRLLAFRTGGRELSVEAVTFLEEVAAYRDETKSQHRRIYDRDEIVAAWRMVAECSFIVEPWVPKYASKVAVQKTTNELIAKLIENVGWAERGTGDSRDFNYRDGLPLLYDGDFVVDPDPDLHHRKRLAVALLKYLFRFRVIQRPPLQSQQIGQKRIVGELLDAHVDDHGKLLPEDRLEELEDDHHDVVRAACDHVASLAEDDAVAMFGRITGTRLGAFSDVM